MIYVRVSGYGQDSTNPMTSEAGRDLNYLAVSGLLRKFRRSPDSKEITFPGNIITYYASGALYMFMLIMQAHIQKKERIVIDASLTA